MSAAEVLAQHVTCSCGEWAEDSVEHAQHQLDALKAAGYAVVELPAPDLVGDFGQVWTTTDAGRFDGPIGDVQLRPDGRIEIRDDYERDYTPADVSVDAAVLLAAVAAAEADR